MIETFKKSKKNGKKLLTNQNVGGILHKHSRDAEITKKRKKI